MTETISLEEVKREIVNGQLVFLKVNFSADDRATYKGAAWWNEDNSLTIKTDFEVMIQLQRLAASIVYYDGGREIICKVRVVDQCDGERYSMITVSDAEQIEPLKPTVENAIMILQQQATIERRANAQKKV
jgi:hypothetical protein